MSQIIEIGTQKEKTSVWDEYVPMVTSGRSTTMYLTDYIAAPANYNELVHRLNNAYIGDEFVFVINNGGGDANAAFMLVNAMERSNAIIRGKLSGIVASAATIITMACNTIEVAPYTQFMIHNYFHGTQGTGNQVKEYVNFTDSEFRVAVKELYAGFLTEAEMNQVSNDDKELWYGAEETGERWANKKKHDMEVTNEN